MTSLIQNLDEPSLRSISIWLCNDGDDLHHFFSFGRILFHDFGFTELNEKLFRCFKQPHNTQTWNMFSLMAVKYHEVKMRILNQTLPPYKDQGSSGYIFNFSHWPTASICVSKTNFRSRKNMSMILQPKCK